MSVILANVFNENGEAKIKIYNGEIVEEKYFKTHDEAVNFLVRSNFTIKIENVDYVSDTYSLWFESKPSESTSDS